MDLFVLSDVNIKSQLISLPPSYSTRWIRLGLETLFGQDLSITDLPPKPEQMKKVYYQIDFKDIYH